MSIRPCTVALSVAFLFIPNRQASSAELSRSTYLKAGFSPVAIATDPSGNIYLAGNALLDPVTGQQGVLVVKLNPTGTQFLYETYINGSSGESASAVAVDSGGNAYVAGTTYSPDFPLTPGGALTTPPTSFPDGRPFVVALDSNGIIKLSSIFGGQAIAQAITIAPDGNILVSGVSIDEAGFPATAGSFQVPGTIPLPYLIKLDPKTPKIVFSTTGVGGSSIAVDGAGDIFVSGQVNLPGYPTTPGAYQTNIAPSEICGPLTPCENPGLLPAQYVTKIDATGSKLIYSTGLNPPCCSGEYVLNNGLAVDSIGNAYVTGWTNVADYPFTTPPPANALMIPFISKLDPTGSKLLFSVAAGGSSLQLEGSGSLYAAGVLAIGDSSYMPAAAPPVPAGLTASLPIQGLPNNITTVSEAYLQQLDSSTGVVRSAEFIDGSVISSASIALGSQGGGIWITGSISQPDLPFTPDALFPVRLPANPPLPTGLKPGSQPGAYLASVAFSEPVPEGPTTSCVLDAATGMHVGVIAPNQLLTLMGMMLGPAQGVTARGGGSDSIAGVTVDFDGKPAKLLYVSSSQINLAVPPDVNGSTIMQIKTSSSAQAVSAPRLFPVTSSNPSMFADLFHLQPGCPASSRFAPPVLARNADGSINSCDHASKPGSVVSLYLNGVGRGTSLFGEPPQIFDVSVIIGGVSAEVISVALENDWVMRVEVRVPELDSSPPGLRALPVTMQESNLPVGPLSLDPRLSPNLPAGMSIPLTLWVNAK